MSFERDQIKHRAANLAAQGVYLGTSSWKYEGWLGQLYTPARYEFRGKVARKRFEQCCLAEYAEVFKTVCVDAAYYNFPNERYLEGLVAQVPGDFRFSFKVTDAITIRKYPNLNRFGERAGKINEHFLNADLFTTAFLKPMSDFREQIGLLIFEFSKFYSSDYARGSIFVEDLDRFLGALPRGWPYGIELRNQHWLQSEYFQCLARHQVAHIFNSWDGMPAVTDQLSLPDSRPHPGLVGARFLLKPGRKHADAVKAFAPYDRVKDQYPEARSAGRALIKQGIEAKGHQQTYIYVNNRLEGNALGTLAAMAVESTG